MIPVFDVQILCKYLDIPNCPNNLNNKMVACINITKQPDIIEKSLQCGHSAWCRPSSGPGQITRNNLFKIEHKHLCGPCQELAMMFVANVSLSSHVIHSEYKDWNLWQSSYLVLKVTSLLHVVQKSMKWDSWNVSLFFIAKVSILYREQNLNNSNEHSVNDSLMIKYISGYVVSLALLKLKFKWKYFWVFDV